MTLENDVKATESARSAHYLIKTCQNLKAQYITVQDDIINLQIKIKDDVAVDTWNPDDIKQLGAAFDLSAGIQSKKPAYRTQLQELKALVNDTDYEAEIQAGIDDI